LGVGRGANNSSPKKVSPYETIDKASDLDGFFGTAEAMENEYEIWNMEREESL
jgi:hypothetical protein